MTERGIFAAFLPFFRTDIIGIRKPRKDLTIFLQWDIIGSVPKCKKKSVRDTAKYEKKYGGYV